jgi:pimeloyl-ACP methyl ester carboxylesterase
MVEILNKFVNNNGVTIHYLESKPEEDNNKVPLIYIPGMLGMAEQFQDEMNKFNNRKCISISLRGCGRSSNPYTGYSFNDQYSDVEAVLNACDFDSFYLMAYSMGVPYAINATLKHSDKIKGLIILDYPPRIPQPPKGWAEYLISNGEIEQSKKHVVNGIENELKETSFINQLKKIVCPVLIIRGLKEGSLLKKHFLEEYKNHLKNVEIIEFEHSGHNLWETEYKRLFQEVEDFMQ